MKSRSFRTKSGSNILMFDLYRELRFFYQTKVEEEMVWT